jgi:hypothetical protein
LSPQAASHCRSLQRYLEVVAGTFSSAQSAAAVPGGLLIPWPPKRPSTTRATQIKQMRGWWDLVCSISTRSRSAVRGAKASAAKRVVAGTRGHSRANHRAPRVAERGALYLQMAPGLRVEMTTSLTVNGQNAYPFRTQTQPFSVASAEEVPAKRPKADARTRTGDPFITRERRVRDRRAR